jgi:hypothetical protein
VCGEPEEICSDQGKVSVQALAGKFVPDRPGPNTDINSLAHIYCGKISSISSDTAEIHFAPMGWQYGWVSHKTKVNTSHNFRVYLLSPTDGAMTVKDTHWCLGVCESPPFKLCSTRRQKDKPGNKEARNPLQLMQIASSAHAPHATIGASDEPEAKRQKFDILLQLLANGQNGQERQDGLAASGLAGATGNGINRMAVTANGGIQSTALSTSVPVLGTQEDRGMPVVSSLDVLSAFAIPSDGRPTATDSNAQARNSPAPATDDQTRASALAALAAMDTPTLVGLSGLNRQINLDTRLSEGGLAQPQATQEKGVSSSAAGVLLRMAMAATPDL